MTVYEYWLYMANKLQKQGESIMDGRYREDRELGMNLIAQAVGFRQFAMSLPATEAGLSAYERYGVTITT